MNQRRQRGGDLDQSVVSHSFSTRRTHARGAASVAASRGIRLRPNDRVIGMDIVGSWFQFFGHQQVRLGKRTRCHSSRRTPVAASGIRSAVVMAKTGDLIGVKTAR